MRRGRLDTALARKKRENQAGDVNNGAVAPRQIGLACSEIPEDRAANGRYVGWMEVIALEPQFKVLMRRSCSFGMTLPLPVDLWVSSQLKGEV
jgi:hypothetical protein